MLSINLTMFHDPKCCAFKFLMCPLSLCNMPPLFQCIMCYILGKNNSVICLVIVNDILISATTGASTSLMVRLCFHESFTTA